MKRIRLWAVLGAAILAPPAFAHDTPDVDNHYQVSGDAQAAPIQAFEVNGSLYLQLRDIRAVPAPLGDNGPIPYKIYGPYMILPAVASVTLHFGNATAYVRALDGVAGSSGDAQATMTPPVDAANPASEISVPTYRPTYAAPAYTPRTVPVSSPVSPVALAPSSDAVTGTISRPGEVASTQGFTTVSAPSSSDSSPNGAVVGPASEGTSLLANLHAARGGVVLIVADGTVAGATAANSTMQACMSRRWACQVEYKGAPPGQVKLETAQ